MFPVRPRHAHAHAHARTLTPALTRLREAPPSHDFLPSPALPTAASPFRAHAPCCQQAHIAASSPVPAIHTASLLPAPAPAPALLLPNFRAPPLPGSFRHQRPSPVARRLAPSKLTVLSPPQRHHTTPPIAHTPLPLQSRPRQLP